MIRIELLLFAQLREAFDTDKLAREVPDGTTVQRAAAALFAEVSDPAVSRLPLLFAVNERYVTADHQLRDGDRVALVTAFSGG